MNVPIKKAVIPAAGLGTRFLPASKVIAKELLPIVDRPTVQWIVEELVKAGIKEIILVISKGKESLLDHFKPHGLLEAKLEKSGKTESLSLIKETSTLAKVIAVYQDEPRGLGHAVL